MSDPVTIQRAYYSDTAAQYDDLHVAADDEHALALSFMIAAVRFFGIRSILDVGSGTGRAILALKAADPTLTVCGVEPVAELRERGYAKGIKPTDLTSGNALTLEFPDGAFDLVCAFGVLHHIPGPRRAVAEMLRVAGRAVFISDANNFGQGGAISRTVKQIIHKAGLWPIANLIKTRGRGYTISKEDGLAYSYSIFDDLPAIKAHCTCVHLLNTIGSGPNLYRSASHVAALGIKHQ